MVDRKAIARPAAVAASILVLSAIGEPAAALSINQTSDIAAGMAAFGASMPLITWSNFVPAVAITGVDPGTGTIATALPGSGLFVKDWISGPGFETAELGVDGPENFSLNFAGGTWKLGLAVSSGRAGAQFQLTTNAGETAFLTLPDPSPGLPYFTFWLTLISDAPFTAITFHDLSGDAEDQYFGNVVSGPAPVPLPSSMVLQLTGLCLLGLLGWRRRIGTAEA
jgi:hypothetical protein